MRINAIWNFRDCLVGVIDQTKMACQKGVGTTVTAVGHGLSNEQDREKG